MAEIVNLRQMRKRRQRAEKQREAEANRVSHGTSAKDRARTDRLRDIDDRRLDAHRRDEPEDGR